jgi:hypothetical protein
MLAEQVEGIEAELAALRSLGRGLIEQMERTDNPAEAARLGQAYSQLAARLGEMVRVEAAIAKGTESSTHVAEIFELFDMVFTEDGNRPWSEIIMEGIDGEVAGGGLAGRGLAEEIAALRVVLRRTFSLAGQADEARSYAHLADIYGSGCNRMMRLLRFRFNKASLIKEAIDEIFKDAIRGILEHDRIRIALGPNTPEGLAYQASLELSEERQKALDARLKAYWKYKHGEDD